MDNKIISSVIKIGSVIITTLSSFVVSPPVVDPSENSGLHWKNIFVFIAGILSILIYDKLKKRKKVRPSGFWFVGLFIFLFIGYEVLYYKCSVPCEVDEFDGHKTYRCIISSSPVKKEYRDDLNGWIINKEPDPIKSLIHAWNCSPVTIWEFKDLMIPYYSFILLYFLMIITLILIIIISVTDKIISNEN